MLRLVVWPLRVLYGLLAAPLRVYRAIRGSMTAASVTLLLVGIVTLNIIWGYPWSGMFAACLSLMFGGWGINRLMRPKLELSFTLPRSAPAGQPFVVTTHATNRSRLPAIDVGLQHDSLDAQDRRPPRRRFRRSRRRPKLSRPTHCIALIQSGERIHRNGTLVFPRRGVHRLPDLVVSSWFPFHLFCCYQRFPSGVRIAITPRVLSEDDDSAARGLLEALGGWSHRLLAGDALDYTGSREYEVGMPVRRWDFPSWARLGRPIVREYQSPTMQQVTLLVDTAIENGDPQAAASTLERVLSFAATAVTELTRKSVRVRVLITGQIDAEQKLDDERHSGWDCESMLIQLAWAKSVASQEADRQLKIAAEAVGHRPLMLFSSRAVPAIDLQSSSLWKWLRIDPPGDSVSIHQTPDSTGSDETESSDETNRAFGALREVSR